MTQTEGPDMFGRRRPQDKQAEASEARNKFVERFAKMMESEAAKVRDEHSGRRDQPEEPIGFMKVYSDRAKRVDEDSPLIKSLSKREERRFEKLLEIPGAKTQAAEVTIDFGRAKQLSQEKTFKITSLDEFRKREAERLVSQPFKPKQEEILVGKPRKEQGKT
jgi:hypothetical protein